MIINKDETLWGESLIDLHQCLIQSRP